MAKNLYSILFISSSTLVAGFLSYLYHPVMIRFLTIEDFGSFESLLSIMSILWVFSNALGLFYVKEVSKEIDNPEYITAFRNTSFKYILFLGISASLLFLISIPFLASYLNIKFYYFIPICVTIIFSFLAITNNAYLQSLKKFKSIASIITSSAWLKLISWFIMVYVWFEIFWALWGYILSQIFTFTLWFVIIKKHYIWVKKTNINKQAVLQSFLWQKKQILQYLFTSIIIALLMNIDILIIKNMFDGETAWYYAAVSVLAKFLIFLGLSIETVYYPQLVKEEIFPKSQILKISIYYIVLTIGALWFFWLFGEIVLQLFKDWLQKYIWLIYPLLIYCGFLAYLSIIVKTLIAYEKYTINYVLAAIITLLIIAIYTYWVSPIHIAQLFMLFGWIGLWTGLLLMYKKT